jgi:hypothetical protein
MDTISPACADAFHLLRMDLIGYLDEAESLATKNDEWDEDRETARRLIPDLVIVTPPRGPARSSRRSTRW